MTCVLTNVTKMPDEKSPPNGHVSTNESADCESQVEDKNKFQNVPVLLSCRWTVSYMCFCGMIMIFTVRANLVLSLVCLFPKVVIPQNGTDYNYTSDSMEEFDYEDVFMTNNETTDNNVVMHDTHWNDKTQGLALSSYYYGSIISPVWGGYVATRSAKSVLVFSMALSALITLVTPLSVTYNAYVTVVLRAGLGFSAGVFEPAMQHLMSNWAPKVERGKMTALSQSGKVVGNVLSFVMSGVLCTFEFLDGWPITFYGTGILCFLWVIAMCFLVYNSPEEHPRISDLEMEYVKKTRPPEKKKINKSTKEVCKLVLKMLLCVPFLCCVLIKFVGSWVFNVQSSNQPMWVRDVLGFDIQDNGLVSSLPYIGQFTGSILAGIILDVTAKKKCSPTIVSKCVFSFCLLVPAGLIFSLSFLTAEYRVLAVSLTVLTTTIYSAVPVVLRLVLIELSSTYTGILMGIVTTVGCVPGMVAPLLTSIITSEGTQENWANIFYICSGLYSGAAIMYLVFGKSEEQQWD